MIFAGMDPTDGKVDRPRAPGGFAPVGFRFERPYQPAEQPPPWVGKAAGLYDDGGRPALFIVGDDSCEGGGSNSTSPTRNGPCRTGGLAVTDSASPH